MKQEPPNWPPRNNATQPEGISALQGGEDVNQDIYQLFRDRVQRTSASMSEQGVPPVPEDQACIDAIDGLNMTPSELDYLSTHGSPEVKAAIAESPLASADNLRSIVDSLSDNLVSRHRRETTYSPWDPHTPIHEYRHSMIDVGVLVANNRNSPADVLDRLVDRYPSEVLSHPAVATATALRHLSIARDDRDVPSSMRVGFDTARGLLQRADVTDIDRTHLFRDSPSWAVRVAAAATAESEELQREVLSSGDQRLTLALATQNPHAHDGVAEDAVRMGSDRWRMKAAEMYRSSSNSRVGGMLATDASEDVRATFAGNGDCPVSLRNELSRNPSGKVRRRVAGRGCSEELMNQFASDPDDGVRFEVASRLDAPDEALVRLSRLRERGKVHVAGADRPVALRDVARRTLEEKAKLRRIQVG